MVVAVLEQSGAESKNEPKAKCHCANIGKLIFDHYRNTTRHRTPAELEKESWLVPGIRFRRWLCMPAGVTLQFCVGSVYAWSVFNKPIDALVDGESSTSSRAPITFTIAIALLGLSAGLMGPWLERNGPRKGALLGTTLFFMGNMLTALALYLKWMWLVWLGYGLVGGAGIGLCYISPVSCLQKWFPDKRGFASGVAVAGFGAGSIVMAKVQVVLMRALGLPGTFLTLGIVYAVLMVIAAFILRSPPPGYTPETYNRENNHEANHIEITTINGINKMQEMKEQETDNPNQDNGDPTPSLIESLTSHDFRLMYIAFLSNIMFGLVLISRLSNMITDIFQRGVDEAATVVAVNSGFNLAGRLFFSVLSDFLGRKNCYVIMLTAQLVILALFSTLTSSPSNYPWFLAAIWILTSCYGAGFSVIPAFLSDKFGTGNVGACHGVILTAWSAAGVIGGVVFTLVFNKLVRVEAPGDPYPYNVNSWWLLGVVVIGWGAILLVKPTQRDTKVLGVIMRCRKDG